MNFPFGKGKTVILIDYRYERFNPFLNKPWFLVSAVQVFKNTVIKEEIARNEQFLHFPQCFLAL